MFGRMTGDVGIIFFRNKFWCPGDVLVPPEVDVRRHEPFEKERKMSVSERCECYLHEIVFYFLLRSED